MSASDFHARNCLVCGRGSALCACLNPQFAPSHAAHRPGEVPLKKWMPFTCWIYHCACDNPCNDPVPWKTTRTAISQLQTELIATKAALAEERELIRKLTTDSTYEGGTQYWIAKHDSVLMRATQANKEIIDNWVAERALAHQLAMQGIRVCDFAEHAKIRHLPEEEKKKEKAIDAFRATYHKLLTRSATEGRK